MFNIWFDELGKQFDANKLLREGKTTTTAAAAEQVKLRRSSRVSRMLALLSNTPPTTDFTDKTLSEVFKTVSDLYWKVNRSVITPEWQLEELVQQSSPTEGLRTVSVRDQKNLSNAVIAEFHFKESGMYNKRLSELFSFVTPLQSTTASSSTTAMDTSAD
jgi:hypothetical protein